MQSNLKASVIIDMAGNLIQQAQRNQKALTGMSVVGARSMQLLQSSASATGRMLDNVGNRYVALATGGAVAAAAKQTIDFSKELTQLGVDAEISDQRLASIRDRIFEVANAPTIRVDPSQLLIGIKEIVARTGELDVAIDNLENIGYTMRATGAEGQDAAALVANYFEKFKISDAQAMLKVLDESAILGHKGAFEMRDLATQGNSVATAYAATGRTGPLAVREMNTMLQILRRTAPTANEAATNFERLIATLTAEKVKDFQKAGIQIWDPVKLKEGTKVARAIPDIIEDILRKTKGDPEVLAKIFDISALKAMNAFALEFRQNGALPSVKEFMAVVGTGSQIMADSARNSRTAAAAIQSVNNALRQKADSNLAPTIQSIADAINDLSPERIQEMIEKTKDWAVLLGTIVVAYKAIQVGSKVAGALGGGGAAGTAGGALGGMMGGGRAIPVYIVDGPMSELDVGAGGAAGKAAGKLRKLEKGTAGVMAAGLVGWEIGSVINKEFVEGTAFQDALGQALARGMAALGSKDAQEALDMRARTDAMLRVELVGDAAKSAKIVKSEGLDVVQSGRVMPSR